MQAPPSAAGMANEGARILSRVPTRVLAASLRAGRLGWDGLYVHYPMAVQGSLPTSLEADPGGTAWAFP